MNRGEGEFKRGEGELNRGEGKVDLESYSNGCRGAMRAIEGLWRELPGKDRFHFVFVFYMDPLSLGQDYLQAVPFGKGYSLQLRAIPRDIQQATFSMWEMANAFRSKIMLRG